MKIAYFIYDEAVVLGAGNGIRAQALKWAELLKYNGHEVVFINPWENYDWKSFDVMHVFSGFLDINWYSKIAALNSKIVFSPIWDANIPLSKLRRYRRFDFPGVRNAIAAYARNLRIFRKVFVRSQYERQVMVEGLGVQPENIALIPIGYEVPDDIPPSTARESFCLHLSTLSQPRKNVLRLVEAAKKFGFRLVLGGKHGTDEEFRPIAEAVKGVANIEVFGFLSLEEMKLRYNTAKVFALPSTEEGVGIVALNAAVQGCEVVITSVGGPKDYFADYAYQVDPYSVDSIGQAVMQALNGPSKQPKLREHVIREYSPKVITAKLVGAYTNVH